MSRYALCTSCFWLLLSAAHGFQLSKKTYPMLLSRPRHPANAQYYSPRDFFNCDGMNFSASWKGYRERVAANAREGFPIDKLLWRDSVQLLNRFDKLTHACSLKFPEVLTRQIPVSRLNRHCLFGISVARFITFRHTLDPLHLETLEWSLGWPDWPLDFMENSEWPVLWRLITVHLEQYRRRGDTSWSALVYRWTEDDWAMSEPKLGDVAKALSKWLLAAWGPGANVRPRGGADALLRLAALRKGGGAVWIQVLGHHLGSSMEPFSMLRRALEVGSKLKVEASFCGQRHPSPGLVCKEFGYCDQSTELEGWFRKYEQRWLGEYDWMPDGWAEASSRLAAIIGSSSFAGKADLLVCGGPGWFCLMLRSAWATPMLMYFAWPIAPLVPSEFKGLIYAQISNAARVESPGTVVVVANWVLAAQFALQAHIDVPVERPHGLHANATYAPVPNPDGLPRIMVTRIGQWARVSGYALLEVIWSYMEQEQKEREGFPFELVFLSIKIRGSNSVNALKYKDFSEFSACIFWPWDVMMLLFNELYTMTVPLLVPEKRWMSQLMLYALRHTDLNWWHLRAASVAGTLPQAFGPTYPLPYLPWIGKDAELAEVSYWYELTDFQQFPHITNFRSVPDMLEKVQNLDIPRVRAGMKAFNERTLKSSLNFYRAAAADLLSPQDVR